MQKKHLDLTTKNKVAHIAGYEKEVAQLEQLKDFLHNAEKYANCGVHIPKGVLLYGYPGVGKTVMAKSIADEHINIVELRAADCTRDNSEEFIQEAFAKAKEIKPCLLLIDEFDKIVGFDRLKAIHLNDSKNVLGAHKDRHEKIGEGNLTLDGIVKIITHPAVCKLPICLETPNDIDGYAREIALLKGLTKNI